VTEGIAADVVMKAELRKRLHGLRNSLTSGERANYSGSITGDILALPAYREARTFMAYMTFGSEFVTDALINDALAHAKTLVLPRINREQNRLETYAVRDPQSDLTAGPWGIREPRPDRCRPVPVAEIDLVLVPGLGFNVRGDRLGYGRGYYDRLLQFRTPRTALVAAAYSVQVLDDIPLGDYDVPVDMVVTEAGTHRRPIALT